MNEIKKQWIHNKMEYKKHKKFPQIPQIFILFKYIADISTIDGHIWNRDGVIIYVAENNFEIQ